MRRWWNRLFVLFILAVAAGSIYAVWPDEPNRYLPDFFNLLRPRRPQHHRRHRPPL